MADTPTVVKAWSAVKKDIGAIAKTERNKQQGFNFRGVDTVVNAVSPVFDKHGVFVTPLPEDITLSTYQTSGGTTMHSAVVKMRYTVRGPAGDSFDGGAYGEAADAGDKAVSKAQSVAYRVFLLQGLTIPTDDPDPDSESHQRASSGPAPRGTAPAGRAGPVTSQANRVALTEAVKDRGLTSDQKIQFRAVLVQREVPQSITDMDEDQAAKALEVLNETFPEELPL